MAATQMLKTGFFTFPSHFNRSMVVGHVNVHPNPKTNTTRLLAGRNSNLKLNEQEKVDNKKNNNNQDDDLTYLVKVGVGSVGGAVLIKYGSVLLPEITKPNIVLSLAMIFTPVLVAVFLLVKQSSIATTEEQT